MAGVKAAMVRAVPVGDTVEVCTTHPRTPKL